jgi:hypothetical protein
MKEELAKAIYWELRRQDEANRINIKFLSDENYPGATFEDVGIEGHVNLLKVAEVVQSIFDEERDQIMSGMERD